MLSINDKYDDGVAEVESDHLGVDAEVRGECLS